MIVVSFGGLPGAEEDLLFVGLGRHGFGTAAMGRLLRILEEKGKECPEEERENTGWGKGGFLTDFI